jgi:hypothetical protein
MGIHLINLVFEAFTLGWSNKNNKKYSICKNLMYKNHI